MYSGQTHFRAPVWEQMAAFLSLSWLQRRQIFWRLPKDPFSAKYITAAGFPYHTQDSIPFKIILL